VVLLVVFSSLPNLYNSTALHFLSLVVWTNSDKTGFCDTLSTKLKLSCAYSQNYCSLVLRTHDIRGHQNISCSSAMLDRTWHLWKCLSVPQVRDWGRHISSIANSLHYTSGIPIRPPLIVFKDNITLSFLDPLLALIRDKQAVTAREERGGCLRPNRRLKVCVYILVNVMSVCRACLSASIMLNHFMHSSCLSS